MTGVNSTACFGPTFLGIIAGRRLRKTKTFRGESIGINSSANEIFHDSIGPSFRKFHVILGRPNIIRMPIDLEIDLGFFFSISDASLSMGWASDLISALSKSNRTTAAYVQQPLASTVAPMGVLGTLILIVGHTIPIIVHRFCNRNRFGRRLFSLS